MFRVTRQRWAEQRAVWVEMFPQYGYVHSCSTAQLVPFAGTSSGHSDPGPASEPPLPPTPPAPPISSEGGGEPVVFPPQAASPPAITTVSTIGCL
jgi:hypothetical protein